MKNKIVKILTLFLLLMIIISYHSSKEETNSYFQNINEEVSGMIGHPEKIRLLQNRELQKYENTGERKYLMGSKYVELYYNFENSGDKNDETGIKQIPIVYELLFLNNNEFDYITIACNFNLAYQFERKSPKLAMQFLNEAIKLDEKLGKKYYLPHLYHLKGRLEYNNKKYSQALYYFNKSLHNLKKTREDLIFVSSMHNNFALCYNKMGRLDLAIKEGREALRILESGKNLSNEEVAFLIRIKGNLGDFYYKTKDYQTAEHFFLQELEFYKSKKMLYNEAVNNVTNLFALYNDTGQTDRMKEMMEYGKSIEAKIQTISDKILINEMIQSYYLKINDTQTVRSLCKKLVVLHHENEEKSAKNLTYISDVLNNFIIKNIDQKHQHKIDDQRLNNRLMMMAVCLIIIIFVITVYTIKKISRKEKELAEKEKIILTKNKEILEQDLKQKEDKITNLHLGLNLKIETEKTFLENIRKMKRSKNIDAEKMVTDLFLKINNLIQIDKKNFDLINESSLENKQFIQKLSEKFPSLTNNELKFCVYYKLELSSKEISILESITEGSARVYKTKIKTKMNVGREVDLNSFLKNM